ncbi:hypothetical protein BKA70DRAFT_1445123 [Coprinopsis sp. MPI-PUGE-AT-0042]|nr:hypothetical protein BKA70DRAFT_1445123 [Coprinopsis sp. MPI-PUGE-AT-0042]
MAHLEAFGDLTPTDKITLGKECHTSRRVLAGYDNLVRNLDGLIPYEDAQRIGYETTIILYMCWEKRLYEQDPQYLQNTFRDELDELDYVERFIQPHVGDMDADDLGPRSGPRFDKAQIKEGPGG